MRLSLASLDGQWPDGGGRNVNNCECGCVGLLLEQLGVSWNPTLYEHRRTSSPPPPPRASPASVPCVLRKGHWFLFFAMADSPSQPGLAMGTDTRAAVIEVPGASAGVSRCNGGGVCVHSRAFSTPVEVSKMALGSSQRAFWFALWLRSPGRTGAI